jgi:hypothetical protein
MQTAKTHGMRRRNTNRNTTYRYCPPGRVSTSFGHPVHISFYLDDLQDVFGNLDKKKVFEIFNSVSHG